jgi:multiple sugar transport system substrate-binding protein
MKSHISISCILAALLLCAGGCGRNSDSKAGNVKLVFATPAIEAYRPIFYRLLDEFEEENPHIDVKYLEIPGNYYQKLLVMIAGRNAPDLMWMGQSFAEFATRGAFLDLSERIEAEIDTREYHATVLGWYRMNGKQLGIPYGIDTEFIAYNKALLDEAGVSYPEDGWGLEEFVEKAKALTLDRNGDGRTDQYGFRGEIDHSAFGAEIISADGSRALCNSPEMIETLEFNLNLVHKWKVAPRAEDPLIAATDEYSIFSQGRAAMMRMYTWNVEYLRERCADVDWDIAGMPRAARPAHWASSGSFLVAADTKQPDAAWLLFRKLLSDDFQLAMSSQSLPANLRVAQQLVDQNTRRPANLKAVLDATEYLYPNPRIPNLQELLGHFRRLKEKVLLCYGTDEYMKPEDAMAEAEKRINRTIERRSKR